MLKKKDLVEQFSYVVKQEIKNHQDAVLATNIAINSINEQMDTLSVRFFSKLNNLEQAFKLQDIRQDRLEKSFVDSRKKMESVANTIESSYKKSSVSIEILSYKIAECEKTEALLSERIDKSIESMIKKFDQIDSLFTNVDSELSRLKISISETSKKTKKEILEMPSELEEVKETLIKKIQEYRVDSDGIIRELAVFKKTLYVVGKEIENTNIQIERLKPNKVHREK